MTDAVQSNSSTALTEPKYSAAQIETDCPPRLQQIAREITKQLAEAREQIDDHVIAINKLIAEAQELCDVSGYDYDKFREQFCPQLGKSQAYVRIAIAAGKTTLVEHRAKERERKRKTRAVRKVAAANSGTVPEMSVAPDTATGGGGVEAAPAANSGTVPEKSVAPDTATGGGGVQDTSTAVQRTPRPTEMRRSGMPTHKVVLEVTARVDDLIRRIGNREPLYFTGIGNPTDHIVKLGIFLLDVANNKEPGVVKLVPIVPRPDSGAVPAEQPAVKPAPTAPGTDVVRVA
jgi:hypothetical protein